MNSKTDFLDPCSIRVSSVATSILQIRLLAPPADKNSRRKMRVNYSWNSRVPRVDKSAQSQISQASLQSRTLLTHDAPSPVRAWFALIRLSIRRQARMQQMVWIALGLLALTMFFVGMNTSLGRWPLTHRRLRPNPYTYRDSLLLMTKQQAELSR